MIIRIKKTWAYNKNMGFLSSKTCVSTKRILMSVKISNTQC